MTDSGALLEKAVAWRNARLRACRDDLTPEQRTEAITQLGKAESDLSACLAIDAGLGE